MSFGKLSPKPDVYSLNLGLMRLNKWSKFAICLPGMNHSEIETIRMENRNEIANQTMAVFARWLELYPDATWDDVLKALEQSNFPIYKRNLEQALASSVRREKKTAAAPKAPKTRSTYSRYEPARRRPAPKKDIHVVVHGGQPVINIYNTSG